MIKEALDRLIELGRTDGRVKLDLNIGGDPYVINGQGKLEDVSQFFPPRRIEQTATFAEAGSFAEYVNRFKTPATLIFATCDEKGATFRAILDYHEIGRPDYCQHVAVFALVPTPDWRAWSGANRAALGQVKFATWLEDYQHLFIEPSGAEFLELVRNLFGKKDAAFNSSIRLDNGAYSVGYQETIELQARTTGGAINLPAQLIAEIQVFEGGDKKQVRARLKTRVEDRKLTLFFETIQMEQLVRECILDSVKEIAAKTNIVPLLGQAS